MNVRGLILFVVCALMLPASAAAQPVSTSPPDESQKALMDRYCVTCHNARTKAGSLVLDTAQLARVPQNAEVWERVIRKLRGGLMPPAGMPRPDAASLASLASYLENELDRAATATPNPGRTETLHRLNRAEYGRAVRDVLSLEIDVAEHLPADDASFGFDNMAGVLKLNQSNMERYLTAAIRVARLAVGGAPAVPATNTYTVAADQSQYERVAGLPFGTRGGTLVKHYFPRDGDYEVKVDLTCTTDVDLKCNGAIGFVEPHELQILLDNAVVQSFILKPHSANLQDATNPTDDGQADMNERWTARVAVKAGWHAVGATFVKGPSVEYVRLGYRKRFERPFRFYADTQFIPMPFVDNVVITGPLEVGGQMGTTGDTPSRRTIFACRPAGPADEERCARQILAGLARKAYRRPVRAADVNELMMFFADGRKDASTELGAGGRFEAGIETAISRILVSANFLFRVERAPSTLKAGANYRITDLELASRLSFFLWSSVPDERLLDAAAKGALRNPAVLQREVRRMLADPRSYALVDNFFAQWLRLRHVDGLRPAESLFPDFDNTLRVSMRRETELLLEHVISTDKSVLDLLTADYTFVNERLARHYGIPNVSGPSFRQVKYPDARRRGLLGHASILTLTSHAVRTSPVFRGKWILENVLGTPPPPPPADVPPLEEEPLGARTVLTMREKMTRHRANPVCAGCHSMLDPAGFALENFDAVGKWRDHDQTFQPLDTTGVLPDGTKFSTLTEFRTAIFAHPEVFVGNLTERLLTYALGRGVEYYDQPAIRRIVAGAAGSNYTFSSVVLGIVTSVPFQMRRADGAGGPGRRDPRRMTP